MAEIIIIGLVVLVLVFFVMGGRQFTPPKTQPSSAATHNSFELAANLFVNRSELAFYYALLSVLPPQYSVHAKVRLEDIVGVKASIKDPRTRWALRNRVKSRHVDFLIIDSDGRLCLAIELDGLAHNNKDAENADSLKDGLFHACGLPLVRVKTGESFQARASEIVCMLE